jgi:cyclophilin family peptidyl-prolyl cis-trans isomerase
LHPLRLLALVTTLAVLACGPAPAAGRSTPVVTVAPRTAAPASGAGTPAVAGTSGKQWSSPPAMALDPDKQYTAVITTTMGDIEIELFAKDAPQTVNNFVFLAREGFYDNVKFHRIIKGFMIQTGDPTGTGSGGPGYRFNDERVSMDYTPGVVAMANAGPNTNGSQFFIVQGDGARALPRNYTIFAHVTSGMDVVDKIANVPVRPSPQGEQSVPTEDARILSVSVSET